MPHGDPRRYRGKQRLHCLYRGGRQPQIRRQCIGCAHGDHAQRRCSSHQSLHCLVSGAVSAAGKNRIVPLFDGLQRLHSRAFRRFGCDGLNFNSGFLEYRNHIRNASRSLIKMLT
jgi:hypothetical protein